MASRFHSFSSRRGRGWVHTFLGLYMKSGDYYQQQQISVPKFAEESKTLSAIEDTLDNGSQM